ncbi:MAG: DUF3857 domain-containing transglutaminase family protein, partial [Planctomycetes bacterium]|nr:DUF3857 domain-containing transglutaminase family protein [Planctomycetota bacterium]
MTFQTTAKLIDDVQEIRKRVESAGGPKDHEGCDTVVVFDTMWVDVEDGGLGHVNTQRVVKILTDAGAAEMGALRFDYDPKSMLVDVKGLRVFRKDGTTAEVDLADPANSLDLFQPARGMFWGPRMKVWRLPRLQAGDAVEIRAYRKGFQVAYLGEGPCACGEEAIAPPMPGHYYEVFLFEEEVPVKEKTYTIALPRNKPIRADLYHGDARVAMDYDERTVRYTWSKKDIPAMKNEKRMAFDTDVKTKLVLATLKTWEEKSRWFHDANKNQFEWDEAIAEKVKEVTAGCATDDEKADALLHWTAQQIRYIGFSMGKEEGWTIHTGKMTFHERGGVCKEYGGMLVTMLRAAGLEAYPVMTQAGHKVEEIPADQFNHCFSAWRRPDGTFKLLDPTWAPYAREVYCTAEQQQHYLIGTPTGESLGITEKKDPDASLLTFSGASTLRSDGTLETEVTITGRGRADTNMRRAVGLAPRSTRRAYFQKCLESVAPGAEIEDLQVSTPDDFTRDEEFVLKFKIPGFHTAGGGLLRFTLPLVRLACGPNFCRHLEVGDLEKRKYPALLWYAQHVAVEETLRLPPGFRLLELPPGAKLDRDTAGFEASVSQEGA